MLLDDMPTIAARPQRFTQRRRPSRHAVCMRCEVVRERDFKLVSRRILDLSETGMLVASDERLLTGESLLVSFRVPFSTLWLDTEAVVARVVHGRRPGDEHRALGLAFEDVPAAAVDALRRNLRSLPPPLPKRAAWLGAPRIIAPS
jgi:c-di-GMP-binding flagellar brake protein YcgR